MKKKTIVSIFITIAISTATFYGGLYYGVVKTESVFEELLKEFKDISEKVHTFAEVSDPKNVRFYVSELHRILDDITFLNNLVRSGQLSDESFNIFGSKLDDVNDNVSSLRNELYDEMESLRLSLTVKMDDKVYGLKEDVITNRKHDRSNVISKFGDVNSKLDLLQRKLDEVNTDMKDVKDSKYGKKIFKQLQEK